MKINRIEFQKLLDELNLVSGIGEMTLVDRYKFWFTGTHNFEEDIDNAQIHFLIELKYEKKWQKLDIYRNV